MPTRWLVLLALLVPAALPAQRPDTIRTGHPLTAGLLVAGTDTVDTYLVSSSGERRLGVVYMETVVPVPGGFLIVQRNERPDGAVVSLDSIEVDRRTLATRWHSSITPRGNHRVTFAGGRMTGTATDGAGATTPLDQPVADGAIDYSIGSLVVPRLPLREGYVATLALHDITRGPQWTTLRVLGREDVTVGDTTVSAWKVATDFGTFTAMQWIDPVARRALRTEVERGTMKIVAEQR